MHMHMCVYAMYIYMYVTNIINEKETGSEWAEEAHGRSLLVIIWEGLHGVGS